MILSYRDARTEAVASGRASKGFPANLVRRAILKLTALEYAVSLDVFDLHPEIISSC
jgi:proteic killer suppression protein